VKKIILTGIIFSFAFAASAQRCADSSLLFHPSIEDSVKYFSLQTILSNYYSSNLAFFCKKEIQVQNAIKLPVKFRLGSVTYCDAMEGKNNSHP
jgi:hypothetical protein